LLLLTLLHQYGGLPLPVAACGGLLPTVPMGSLLEPASGFFEALVPVLPSLHPLGSSLLACELLSLATAQVRSCGPTRCSRVSKHARRMGLRTESLLRRSPNFREFHTSRNCLENREGGVWAVLFSEARRQNKPLCPLCRLTEMPVWGYPEFPNSFSRDCLESARRA
jgi:hypothetical protein